ncbi:MAG: HigA family addiction module antidote protein [Kiritimatiellae bacterium]|nr:HigA family addiction module antidote protein [Kiritimatiellia bacterium]
MDNDDKYYRPIHPGEILLEEFLKPLEMSRIHLAKEIGVAPRIVNELVNGKRPINADMAMRLSRFFGTTAQLWLNLQAHYELDCVQHAVQTKAIERFAFIKKFLPKSAAAL